MRTVCSILMLALIAASAVSAPAQLSASYGKVTGEDGKPLADATVVMVNNDTARKFTAKTDKKGEYVLVNIGSGMYHVTISRDGKVIYEAPGKSIKAGEDFIIDLAKEKTTAKEREMQGLTPEQRRQIAEEQQKEEKERANLGSINQLLAQAKAASDAGDFDAAVSNIKQAIQIDSSKDLLWSRLGEAYLAAARKASAAAARDAASEDYNQAAEAYRKAISIKPSEAGYHNNLGQAMGKLGKTDEAAAEYTTAAQLDPGNAGLYYFNLGAILTNTGKIDEANAAFDRAIAANPPNTEAYYWKGVNLLSKASLDKSGKMVAVPGTVEAFQKYLALEPTGRYAPNAKEMLTSIGGKIETTFTKGKGK